MRTLYRREFAWSSVTGLLIGLLTALAAAALTSSRSTAITAGLTTAALITGFTARRWLRRLFVLRHPFDPAHRLVLERDVAFYTALPPDQRAEFERNVQCFLAEHTISGPKGADIADDVKVLVAASAAMLLFGRQDLDLPDYVDVVVYPTRFDDESFEISQRAQVSGMVRWQGPVIFSERDLRDGFARARDGLNVGLHEFAHLLDLESGHFDGVPSGMPWIAASPWLELVHREMHKIEAHRSVLRSYGATNDAEFFAVATEAFFERPNELQAKHPKLYAAMRSFFGQDPAQRIARLDDKSAR